MIKATLNIGQDGKTPAIVATTFEGTDDPRGALLEQRKDTILLTRSQLNTLQDIICDEDEGNESPDIALTRGQRLGNVRKMILESSYSPEQVVAALDNIIAESF